MQAIVLKDFGGTEQFELQNLPMPTIGEGEVLIEIKASAFNPIDYQMRMGLGESKLLKSQILGREFSGRVIDSSNSTFKAGEAVYAYCGSLGSNGAYASHISVPGELIAPMPEELNFIQAAAVPMVALTAMQCFERLQISPKETVFIAGGAGGVGFILVQLLLHSGVTQIVTTAGNEKSRQALQRLGLPDDAIVNYRQDDLIERLIMTNNGEFFNCSIDIVGGQMSEVCSSVMSINGKFADISALTTTNCRNQLFDKAATVYNIANYALAGSGDKAGLSYYGERLGHISRLFSEGKIVLPEVVSIGGLDTTTVAEAHHILESNAANGRRLVMKIG